MKYGVFVGSFDPVHLGHIGVMNYLVQQNIVDQVLVIPTKNYWDKQNISDLKVRSDMLNLIKNESIIVNTKYSNYDYTYQILEELKRNYPNDRFYLVIGADNALTFSSWKHYLDIIENGIIVVGRNGIDVNLKGANIILINHDFGDISSTLIRSDVQHYQNYLDKRVYQYIKENKLYSFGG